ncbi:MAG: LamG domain-containing protein [Holophagales bacterium]|nr:LamG domain-containing protein [Holophagales bacterium]
MHRSGPCRPFSPAASAVLLLLTSLTVGAAYAAEPFGATDFDAVYSDTTSVHYQLSRACLADQNTCLGTTGLSSLCRQIDPITGLRCNAGIHRFCAARGHTSGYGVENAADSNLVDITCVTSQGAATFDPLHTDLAAKHGGCTNAVPSLACNVAIDRFCRGQTGFTAGFGPVERGPTKAVVACVRDQAARTFSVAASQVEGLVAGCSLGASLVSTECRQAMDLQCESEASDLRGGFGPRELGTNVNLGCVETRLDWSANPSLPESPAHPVDILGSRVDPATGGFVTPREHNSLGASRSLSFDGRINISQRYDGNGQPVLQFRVQTPEIFPVPLSQEPVANKDRSYEQGFYGDYYGFDVAHTFFHNSSGGTFEGASTAICDPHQGAGSLVQANRQQSVPDRVSNPYACNSTGGSTGSLDHDCYELTVVTVYDTGSQDELWGTPVQVVVKNPKGSGINGQASLSTRAHVVGVQVLGASQKASFTSGEPRNILEPNITGDGRLIVIQGDGLIQYSVMESADTPCDVTKWTALRFLHEMHTDSKMADYGIAKYPIRDLEGDVLSPSIPGNHVVRAGYPWIDRDGDNMMFMLGSSTLFYMDEQGQAQEKLAVVSHPYSGTAPDIPCGTGCTVPLHPSTRAEVEDATDHLPRVGLTFVGLWTQGKMFTPDSRNNAADYAVPGGARFHRNVQLYSDAPSGHELGTTIRTSINSVENQFFYHPRLRPDMPREVVWFLSTQGQTDEVAFDDVIDPRALIVSPMNTSIRATNPNRGRFQDGFVYTGLVDGEGFQFPSHMANAASAVSDEVVTYADTDLSANVQWNPPAFGYLLGGARAEPVAAGGFKGRGLWLDGTDDRLEYLVPPQPTSRVQQMEDGAWFYNLSIDPRDLSTRRRLLTLPDGTWLDVASAQKLVFGRSGDNDVNLPLALALEEGVWSTIGIVSEASGASFEVRFYVDGYLLETFTPGADYFRMAPGRVTVGAVSGGFQGWVDDFKVLGRAPSPEVLCNHARGTLIGVGSGDPLDTLATAYPTTSHQAISALLPAGATFPRYACERPIDDPVDIYDLADHASYTCLGQIRRLDGHPDAAKCLRETLLFPEGAYLAFGQVRPSSTGNSFCTSCHVDSNPSVTMAATDALSVGIVNMEDDARRQPMQVSPKIFGYVPQWLFGSAPVDPCATPVSGESLDQPLADICPTLP